MLKMVLQSFIKHHAESGEEIRQLVKQGQFDALGKLAHKLKGAACIMQAPLVISAAEALENQIQIDQIADPVLTEDLASLMAHWVTEVQHRLNNL